MTGMTLVPVSIASRRHFQGMSTSIEGGVCPKAARNFLDGFFFALAMWPRSITLQSIKR